MGRRDSYQILDRLTVSFVQIAMHFAYELDVNIEVSWSTTNKFRWGGRRLPNHFTLSSSPNKTGVGWLVKITPIAEPCFGIK